jgi:hypothetical protein
VYVNKTAKLQDSSHTVVSQWLGQPPFSIKVSVNQTRHGGQWVTFQILRCPLLPRRRRPMELTWPREDLFETTTGC